MEIEKLKLDKIERIEIKAIEKMKLGTIIIGSNGKPLSTKKK